MDNYMENILFNSALCGHSVGVGVEAPNNVNLTRVHSLEQEKNFHKTPM